MSIEIRMPQPAPEIEEADLIAWLVEPGTKIALGDPILEIETEKSTLEIEAPCSGVLEQIIVPAGSLGVPVATLLGLIEPSETDSEPAPEPPSDPTSAQSEPPPQEKAESAAPSEAPRASEPAGPPSTALARRLAERAGIPLESVQGSGFHGRVTRADVERSPGSPSTSPSTSPNTATNTAPGPLPQSLHLGADCRVDSLIEILAQLEQSPGGSPIPLEVALLKATALGIRDACEIPRSPGPPDELTGPAPVDIALSSPATPDGPRRLRGVDRKGWAALVAELADPVSEAGDTETNPPQFALAHLGVEGVDRYCPPLEPGTLVSVATSQPRVQPLFQGESATPGYVLSLTLCADPGAIEAPGAARLLARIRHLVEHPLEMAL